MKLLMTGVIVSILMSFFSGCTKKEVVPVSPRVYAVKNMNGPRNWSGKYQNYVSNYTIDTNFSFVLKPGSDSTVVIELPGRTEVLSYAQTDEITKTVEFARSYQTPDNYEYMISLTYYYADNHIIFKEYYAYRDYGMHVTNISNLDAQSN